MKSRLLLIFVVTFTTGRIQAQSTQWNELTEPEKEIIQVVIDVFDGMRAGDSAAVKKHFYSIVSSNTAFTSNQGKKELRVDDINIWFNAIAKPHDQVWDERIWDYECRLMATWRQCG